MENLLNMRNTSTFSIKMPTSVLTDYLLEIYNSKKSKTKTNENKIMNKQHTFFYGQILDLKVK